MAIKTRNISPYSPLRTMSFMQHLMLPPNDAAFMKTATATNTYTVGTPVVFNGGVHFPSGQRSDVTFHWPFCPMVTRSNSSEEIDWQVTGVDQFGEEQTESIVVTGANLRFQTSHAYSFIRSITPTRVSGAALTTWSWGFSYDAFDTGSPPTSGGSVRSGSIGIGMKIRDLDGNGDTDAKRFMLVGNANFELVDWVDPEHYVFNLVNDFASAAVSAPATIVYNPLELQ